MSQAASAIIYYKTKQKLQAVVKTYDSLELREEVYAKKVKMEKLETMYFKQMAVSYIKLRFSFCQTTGYCNH